MENNKVVKSALLELLWNTPKFLTNHKITDSLQCSLEQVGSAMQELYLENRLPPFYKTGMGIHPWGTTGDYHNDEQELSSIWQKCEHLVFIVEREFGISQGNGSSYWNISVDILLECSKILNQTHFSNIQSFMKQAKTILTLSILFHLKHEKIVELLQEVIDYHRDNNNIEQYMVFSVLYLIYAYIFEYPMEDLIHYAGELKAYERSIKNPSSEVLLLLGILHCGRAEYASSLEYYKKYIEMQNITLPILHEYFCLNVSLAALFTKNYTISVGIIESQRNTNELLGKTTHALFWRVHLSFVLLHTKNYDEAKNNFMHIIKTIEPMIKNQKTENFFLSRVFYTVQRGLAFYHYAHHEYDLAYEKLTTYPPKHIENRHACYRVSDPKILKMILDLEKNKKTPLYTIEIFKNRSKQGLNLLLQGVLDRHSAYNENDEDKKSELLKLSFDNLMSIDNKAEALESALLYLESLKRQKKTQTIKNVQMQVDTLEVALKSMESDSTSILKKILPISFKCISEFQKIKGLYFATYIHKLLNIIQEELEVQRVGLIKIENDKILNVYQLNISEEEQKDPVFQLHIKKIIQSFQEDEKNEIQYRKVNPRTCAIYFRTITKDAWILYLDNSFTYTKFAQMTEKEAVLLGLVVLNEIRIANNLNPFEVQNNSQKLSNEERCSYFGVDLINVINKANLVAPSDVTVLIQGETGTGKEDLARYIYKNSVQKGIFIPVQLASLSEQLFESTLFGHERGSFTGAYKQQIGLLELAHNGTLFIDEVADIPLSMQIKLLRVLQEKHFSRVGGTQLLFSNFRIMCATNKNLSEEVKAGRFREDLYYRLSTVPLFLPALRNRPNDLGELIQFYLEFYTHKYSKPELLEEGFSVLEQTQLQSYFWPGNIRELQSVIERYVIFNQLELNNENNIDKTHGADFDKEIFAEMPTMKEIEKKYIQYVLEHTKGKVYGKEGALGILGLSKSTLYARMNEYNMK